MWYNKDELDLVTITFLSSVIYRLSKTVNLNQPHLFKLCYPTGRVFGSGIVSLDPIDLYLCVLYIYVWVIT